MTEDKLRSLGTSEYRWKYTQLIVDQDNINDFIFLENRRQIRKATITRLVQLLASGGHFESPIVVNKVDDKYRLLDGNHRTEAMITFFTRYPNRRIKVPICYYEDLTIEEEREVYTKWNLGTKQNWNDFVKQYWDTFSITKKLKMTKGFPCDVGPAWTTKRMEFRLMVSAYLGSQSDTYIGMYQRNVMEFIDACQQLNDGDLQIMKVMMQEYIDIFGLPDKKSMYYRPAVYAPIADIWYRNSKNMMPHKIQARLKKLLGSERVVHWGTQGGSRTNLIQARKDFVEVMNGTRKRELLA